MPADVWITVFEGLGQFRHGGLADLGEGGAGVLLISSDLPEILHLTNRTYVMYRGDLRAELKGAEITQDSVLANFFERTRA